MSLSDSMVFLLCGFAAAAGAGFGVCVAVALKASSRIDDDNLSRDAHDMINHVREWDRFAGMGFDVLANCELDDIEERIRQVRA